VIRRQKILTLPRTIEYNIIIVSTFREKNNNTNICNAHNVSARLNLRRSYRHIHVLLTFGIYWYVTFSVARLCQNLRSRKSTLSLFTNKFCNKTFNNDRQMFAVVGKRHRSLTVRLVVANVLSAERPC